MVQQERNKEMITLTEPRGIHGKNKMFRRFGYKIGAQGKRKRKVSVVLENQSLENYEGVGVSEVGSSVCWGAG
jgi:hypothetical protein